jgi:hypothetical protein
MNVRSRTAVRVSRIAELWTSARERIAGMLCRRSASLVPITLRTTTPKALLNESGDQLVRLNQDGFGNSDTEGFGSL